MEEGTLELPEAPKGEEIVWDYAATDLTPRRHPLVLLRPRLGAKCLLFSKDLQRVADDREVSTCGIVTLRQQLDTANGTLLVSLEDEHGAVQVIVWQHVREAQRQVLLASRLLAVKGHSQREGLVCNLSASKLVDLAPWLGRLATASRDFR